MADPVVILTANYTFLNYLVLPLGCLLLDDRFCRQISPSRWKQRFAVPTVAVLAMDEKTGSNGAPVEPAAAEVAPVPRKLNPGRALMLALTSVMLLWIFYVTALQLIWMFSRVPLPVAPVAALEPFRIANRYGLFAVMTRGRYEIEFQGSNDGEQFAARLIAPVKPFSTPARIE